LRLEDLKIISEASSEDFFDLDEMLKGMSESFRGRF